MRGNLPRKLTTTLKQTLEAWEAAHRLSTNPDLYIEVLPTPTWTTIQFVLWRRDKKANMPTIVDVRKYEGMVLS